ncbi:MAG: hypothetical protein MJZ12_00085 [Prevotella sp.]|nr:hypothetical protein [Prevotella sp.]
MLEINEIKSIEITLHPDKKGYTIGFNGEVSKEGYSLLISEENARAAARSLTRAAMAFWDRFDVIASKEEE